MSLLVDETLIPRCVNLLTIFREPPFRVEISPSGLKHMYSILSTFIWKPMPLAAFSRLYCRDLAWVGVSARSVISSALSTFQIVSARYRLPLDFFLVQSYFLLFDLSTFEVHSLGRLWTDMRLMYPLAEHQQQCQKSLCSSSERTLTFVLLSNIIFIGKIKDSKYLLYIRRVCN